MISLDKKYRTKGGLEVRLYAVDVDDRYCIHGAVKIDAHHWSVSSWNEDGLINVKSLDDNLDLIEIKPRIKHNEKACTKCKWCMVESINENTIEFKCTHSNANGEDVNPGNYCDDFEQMGQR